MTRLIRTALVAALGLLTVGGATADDAEDVVAAAQGVLKAYNSGDAKKASSLRPSATRGPGSRMGASGS